MENHLPAVPASTSPPIIAGIQIRQDECGRYCLNDLHKAAGGESRHQPANWLRLDTTKELTHEVDSSDLRNLGNTGSCAIPGIPGIESKQGIGTFVCKQLVYAYAMWISPKFHLKVIDAYDAIVTAPPVDPYAILQDPAAMRGLLLGYTEKVLELEHKVVELSPKADVADRISRSTDYVTITDAAKVLQVRPKWFSRWLRVNKWVYQRPGNRSMIPYQEKIVAGYMDLKYVLVPSESDQNRTFPQAIFMPKGITRLAAMFAKGIPEVEYA